MSMKTESKRPYLWIICFTILALTIPYLIDTLPHQISAKAGSALEPTFSIPSGYYDRDIQLEITSPNPVANAIFTVDGSLPSSTVGEIYTQPIHLRTEIPAVTVIRARTVLPGGELGPVASASYFVGVRARLPMMSLIVEPDDLWSLERGIYVNPHERGITWERPVDVTYVDTDRRLGFCVPAGVRIHGRWSRRFEKKSLRLYFRQEYGTSFELRATSGGPAILASKSPSVNRLEYPLFAKSPVQSFKRLVLHSGGHDYAVPPRWNWTLMRNRLADDLALQLGGYATYSQPTLLFINGEPWGIYYIRERLEDRFLADHYGIESADFLEEPEWSPNTLTGDDENWNHLLQFVDTHDLADPANYAYVQSQVDIANFIDYNILQIYSANLDWPHANVHQFRSRVQGGRWRWIFWDSDNAFGAEPEGSVDLNMIQYVLDYVRPETGGRDTLLLRKLLKNPAFRQQFLSRTADLLNTTLAPSSVVAQIDAIAAELGPDMAYETMRWPLGSVEWQTNVQEMRDFARDRPGWIRQHIVERFELNGTAQLTFKKPAGGSGHIAVNGLLVPDLPWQGTFFQGLVIQVSAVPTPGYRFAGWDPPDLPQTPIITLTANTAMTITSRFEPIDHDAVHPGDVILVGYHTSNNSHLTDDQFELQVTRPGGVDLRGWRVTDNDSKTATDEGSLIFADIPAFAHVPRGTTILIVATQASDNHIPLDDLDTWDRQMVLYEGNGNLDNDTDPGFNLGPTDNLVLLAPGPTRAFSDDQGIAFVSPNDAVTPGSFGILTDGVLPTH
ncbi:MAG: hypothetical protein GY832_21865 [Chloroflexi bacterium]|nr:hypothetical protein [Chloroflexota bacterium]